MRDDKQIKTCYVSIGGNLGDRLQCLYNTHKQIELRNCRITKISSIYISEAWGFLHKNYFLNQVLELVTSLQADELLHEMQAAEYELGRIEKTGTHYAGRKADIDIISIDNTIISNGKLILPHPHMQKRKFVLKPLAEIAPNWIHPISKQSVYELLDKCTDNSRIRRLKLQAHE